MSTLPPAYTRQASFTGFSTEPAPTVGQDLEAEFSAIKQSQDKTQARLSEVQRDDGRLRNLVVTPDSLDEATRALLVVADGAIRGDWLTATVYNARDVVNAGGSTYVAVTSHLSNASFSVDLNAGRWIALHIRLTSAMSADDAGLLGNASDETASIQGFLYAGVGKVLMLGYGKTYGVGAGGITIPSNTTLITNGSKFKKLATGATYGITVESDVDIDSLILETPGGAFVADAGISVTGGNARIGRMATRALIAGAATGYGVSVGTGVQGSPIANVNIGRMESDGFRTAARLFEVDHSHVAYYKSENCEQGLYIRDCEQTVVNGGVVESMWASTDGSAGDNGILIESVASDYACRDVYLNNITVKVSGEHGFRVGGSKKVLNIRHNTCGAYRSGSGSASAGGSGFKALGGTIATPHEEIHYTNCYAEDAGSSNSNWSGIVIGLCDGVHIKDCSIRARTLTNSGFYGIWIDSSRNVTVSDCQSRNANTYALYISAQFTGFDTENINVVGGIYDLPAVGFGSPRRCIVVSANNANVKNVSINGAMLRGGEIALSTLAPGVGFGYTDCYAKFSFRNPSSTVGNPPVLLNNSNDFLVHVDGPWYGTFSASGRDGSIFHDLTNGVMRERRAGVWWEAGERFGKWTPTFSPVTNVDAATANGTWRWLRVGDIVHFSGSVNIDNTAINAVSELGVSLTGVGAPAPASNFTSFADAAGAAIASTPSGLCASVQADTVNDRLAIKWQAGSTTDNRAWFVTGSYEVK